jgi:hypothetical protein
MFQGFSEKWGVGSRQDQEPLTFSTVPGRRVPLPETTTVSDYFNIFIKDDDFEEIATETNRYAEQYFENNQNLESNKSVLPFSLFKSIDISSGSKPANSSSVSLSLSANIS